MAMLENDVMRWTRVRLAWAGCVAMVCAGAVSGQNDTQPTTIPDQQSRNVKLEDLHWAVRLGARVERVNQAFATVDRVVLVPDAATYVDELRKWSPGGRWPVLFEDDVYAPMFIRRFEPAQVIRRESAGSWPREDTARQALLNEIIVSAFGGQPGRHTVKTVFDQQNHQPPGVVFTSVHDDAWPAAVALAAGRGQPLAFLDRDWGRPNGVIETPQVNRLRERINDGVAALGYAHEELGDAIETVTICRRIAGRVKDVSTGTADPIAITDYLARNPDGTRYGFAGWIFGDQTRSAYLAMCSLFLERTSIALINTYPRKEQWNVFAMHRAQRLFTQRAYTTTLDERDELSPGGWSRLLRGGLTSDIVMVNSKGNRSNFEINQGRAQSVDVPVLNTPAAVYFVHSWSFVSPGNSRTVGAQWLQHGAYAYVGAVDEPYLAAFVPPSALAERITSYVPLLVAARHWDGPKPFAGPWKVNTYGDPLMLCRPPSQTTAKRVQQVAGYGVELKTRAKNLLETVRDNQQNDAVLAEAMRTLNLLGRDEMVIHLWKLAKQRGHESTCAGEAIGALFRAHDRAGVVDAFRAGVPRTSHNLDLLWHIAGIQSGAARDKDELLLLQSAVRDDMPDVDLERLAPHLARAFSQEHALSLIERHMNRAGNNHIRKKLRKLADSIR